MRRSFRFLLAVPVIAAATLAASRPTPERAARFWGAEGHTIVGQAAAAVLPASMPEFFRNAAPQLAYLNPEPDRWRAPREAGPGADHEMDAAFAPEHFIDLEQVQGSALQAPDRYAFLDSMHAAGLHGAGPGLLPFRIMELTERLRVEFRLWRQASDRHDDATRLYVEQRILNDAGILGHYVADGSNPHHTTIHHDRWVGATNPKGYTTEKGFHGRFESAYVRTHMTLADVQPLVAKDPQTVAPLRGGVLAYLGRSHDQLERLYDLDKQEPFGPNTASPDHKRFTADRLAAGAAMLRDIWWTAWVTSIPVEKRN